MNYQIRTAQTEDEVSIMASFSMMTILETIPEARSDPSIVPGFSYEEMTSMYREGLENPNHRYLVATNEKNHLVAHGIYLLRRDDAGSPYGYFYTWYVLPEHRRRGLGGQMLDAALHWFQEMKAEWAEAHTHPSNTGLKKLFTSRSFDIGPVQPGRWDSVLLKKSLI